MYVSKMISKRRS